MIQIDFTTKPKEITQEYVVSEFGHKYTLDENGSCHSYNDNPAYWWADETREWFSHGLRHRDNDLPAVIYPNGYKEWWKKGNLLRKEYP